jgi:hypothetical protein
VRAALLIAAISLLAPAPALGDPPLRCRAEDPAAAVLRLSAAFRVDPIPELLPEIGACLARLGQSEGAIAVLETYLGLEPAGPLAARARASLEALRRRAVALGELRDPFPGGRAALHDLRDPFGDAALRSPLRDLKSPF